MPDKNKQPKKEKPQKKKRATKGKEKPKSTLDQLITSMKDKRTHSDLFADDFDEDAAFWQNDD